ncbi:MAG: DUF1573 domain-containing protein [Candidatus Kapaibacterium sp.]
MNKFVTTALWLFAAFSINALAQPKLVIENEGVIDWGTVKITNDNRHLESSIKFHNKGDKKLHITQIKPACGCTTAPLDKEWIEPGDYATLDVTLRLSPSQAGKVHKTISVYSNDAENHLQRISLKAYVDKPLEVVPRSFYMNNAVPGEPKTATVRIKNTTDKPIRIMKIEKMPDDLNLNIQEGVAIAPKSELTVEGKYTASEPGSRISGRVTLYTDHPDEPSIIISLWGNVMDKAVK